MNIAEAFQGMYTIGAPVRRKAWASCVYVAPGSKDDPGPWLHYMSDGTDDYVLFIPEEPDYLTNDWVWYEEAVG